jgi:hypothetical protein
MGPSPTILSPRSPSELLKYIVSYQRYPTTLLIGCAKQDFLDTLVFEVTHSAPSPTDEDPEIESRQKQNDALALNPLLRAPLMQVVISRHIRTVFVPTVTHLRAYLATFSLADSKVPAPPVSPPSQQKDLPLLLVYGFLELHRDASEWSAQGLSISSAALVDAALDQGLRAAIVEPRGAAGHEATDQFLDESVPVLSGGVVKNNGAWRGRVTQIRSVFNLFGFTVTNDTQEDKGSADVDIIEASTS